VNTQEALFFEEKDCTFEKQRQELESRMGFSV
jgi:hypothetical protein